MTGEQKPGGLEVVAWAFKHDREDKAVWLGAERPVHWDADQGVALTPAEPAEARIRELEARVAELLRESASIAEGRRFQRDRATAAEAKLARAVEGLERIVHWRVEMTGTPVDTEAANAWAITFDAAATEASQTLAALQQEGE